MKDASDVPDLWRMLRDGLPYLTRSEAREVQLALAVSLYAHSESTSSSSSSGTRGQQDDRVKVCVHCLSCTSNIIFNFECLCFSVGGEQSGNE